jgi:cyanophycinase
MSVLLRVAEVIVPRICRNKIAFLTGRLVLPVARVRRPFAAALAAVCVTVVPALAGGEPKATEAAPRAASNTLTGALVIVGGGGFPDDIRDRFLKLAGGKQGKLVVIPTASEKADLTGISPSLGYWQKQGLASVSQLHTLDRKKANDRAFVKPLTEATAAWLDGGDQTRLYDAYHDTAVEEELRHILKRGGVIGGTSAGASIMSAIMITGGNPQATIGRGFGLLPNVVIDQHFQNRNRLNRLLGVLKKHPSCLGLGIDEDTAVVVSGQTFTVLGKANVSLCLPPIDGNEGKVTLLKPRDEGNLLKLSERLMARVKTSPEGKPVVAKTSQANTP